MRRWTVVAVLLLLSGAACGDDGGSASAASTTAPPQGPSTSASPSTTADPGSSTTTTPAPSGPEARELADAVERASGLSYHAVYEGESQSANGVQRATTIEVWRVPPLARRDTVVTTTAGSLRVLEFRTTDGIVACLDLSVGEDAEHECQQLALGESVDPAEPIFDAVNPGAGEVTASDSEEAGVAVRCYQVAAMEPQEACFDADGIPVVVDDGSLRLVRTSLDHTVDESALQPPN